MLAIPDPISAVTPPQGWETVLGEVNGWRGACIHHFTAVEQAVTECLVGLHAAKTDGAVVRLRHLVGQRFEDLANAIAPGGPFAGAGSTVAATLSTFRSRHEGFRTLLCHSQMTVSVEISGKWVVVARSLIIRGSRAERMTTVIEEAEAATRLADLKRDGQKLSAQLGSLRKSVGPAWVAPAGAPLP
jgi:hypothetical protein